MSHQRYQCSPVILEYWYLGPYFSIKKRKAESEGPNTFYLGLGNKAAFYSVTQAIRSFAVFNKVSSAKFLFPSLTTGLSHMGFLCSRF